MIVCKLCGTETRTIKGYVEHCRIHSNQPNLRLPCCYAKCHKTANSYMALRKHAFRDHTSIKSNRKTFTVGESSLGCNVLACIQRFSHSSDLMKHLKQHIRDGIRVSCPMKGCTRVYSVVNSFVCHLSRDHSKWVLSDLKSVLCPGSERAGLEPMPTSLPQSDSATDDCNELESSSVCHDDDDGCMSISKMMDMKGQFVNNLSQFFVKLSTQLLIPETSVQKIAAELHSVNEWNMQYIKKSVQNALCTAGVGADAISTVDRTIDDNDLIKECLQDGGLLSSSARRATQAKQNLNFVQPESVYLGIDSANKMRYCQYVPIKKSLTCLLRDSTVVAQCKSRSCSATEGILVDFTDGSVYKENAADRSTSHLSLILYQDGFEVANPLGSAKKKHKLLAVYFNLGNLEVHNRSNIDQTQLVLLALESDVSRVGHKIFDRLVTDLRQLEIEGIQVGDQIYHVMIAGIAGDNLGSHWLGGFLTNFSSGSHICRFCEMTRAEFDSGCIAEQTDLLRTPLSYDRAVASLKNSDVVVVDGVKSQSVFNSLTTFHVCKPGLPPCLAHDVFEGIVSYDIALFLKQLNKMKVLNVKQINIRIQKFQFSPMDANVRPALLNASLDRLCGSASQNWSFIRFLPLILSDILPEHAETEIFMTMMLLRTVVEYVVAPKIALGQIAYMKILIEEYLERRRRLFPEVPLRPKHHYLTHYPSLTLKFGPLIRFWTMRFESKHQYFKRCIRSSKNFVNVAKMLATRHQTLQSYFSAGPRFPTEYSINSTAMNVNSLSGEAQILIRSVVTDTTSQCFSEITFKGTAYKKDLLLPYEIHHWNKTAVFGAIECVVVSEVVQLIVKMKHAVFNHCFNCYQIVESSADEECVACLQIDQFIDFYPLSVYKVNDNRLVVLKHQIVDAK